VYIEINLRHKLPPEPFLSLIPSSKTVVGLDAHSAAEVKELSEIALGLESKIATWDKRGLNERFNEDH
jgi:hypothetical protein